MCVAKKVITRAFDAGFIVKVDDGDGSKLAYGSIDEAWAAIKAVEEASVYIQTATREEWMLVLPDLDDDETVADCSNNGWIEAQLEELIDA